MWLAAERELGNFDSEGVGAAFAASAGGLVEQQSVDRDIDSQRFLSALFDRLVKVEGQSSKSR